MLQPMPHLKLDHRATYDDLVAVPGHLVAEIVDGELWTSPRPAPRHAMASSELGVLIGGPFGQGRGGPGGWRIIDEPELHLDEHVVVPDIAGWRLERMPRLPDTGHFPVVPDWVCEVLSPLTAAFDRARKLGVYAVHGVRHAWLVDPTLQTLEVLRLSGAHWTLLATFVGRTAARAEPFEAIELELGSLWTPDAPDEARDRS